MAESSTLKPECILRVTTETEARIWAQGGLTNDREKSLNVSQLDAGWKILQ